MLDPENTKRLIDTIGEWNIAAADELLRRGVDCITLCDDLGSADNLLISPESYEKFIQPWHRRLCDLAHSYGAYIHLHSHGNLNKIIDKVIDTGVDMLNPFDMNESMDLVEFLGTSNGKKTVPVGGLHRSFFGWDDKTRADYLESLFKRAKKAGRWVLMDPAGVSENVSLATYESVMEKAGGLSSL